MRIDERTRRLRELLTALEDPVGLFVVFRSIEDKAEIAKILAAVLDTEWDRQEDDESGSGFKQALVDALPKGKIEGDASPWDSHGQIRWKGDASPVAPQGIAHEWRFDTIIGHYRCNRCLARDDGSHGPTCPKAILPDPPVQP